MDLNSSKKNPNLTYYCFYGVTALDEAVELHNKLEYRLNFLDLDYELDLVVGEDRISVVMELK